MQGVIARTLILAVQNMFVGVVSYLSGCDLIFEWAWSDKNMCFLDVVVILCCWGATLELIIFSRTQRVLKRRRNENTYHS